MASFFTRTMKGDIAMKRNFKMLSMPEFMRLTRTPRNAWIFKMMDRDLARFYKVDDIIYFENGKGVIRRFKESHGKILFDMKKMSDKRWGLWDVWDATEW